MTSAPPLRFLGIVVGGWVCARAAVLAPLWATEEAEAEEAPAVRPLVSATVRKAAAPTVAPATQVPGPAPAVAEETSTDERTLPPSRVELDFASGSLALAAVDPPPVERAEPPVRIAALDQPLPAPSALAPVQPIAEALAAGPGPVTVSGWAIVRQGGGPQLAPGGELGGSQVGLRATYRITQSIALSGRLSSPFERDGAEAAVGVEWQPSRALPVKLLAERRQAIGKEGRSDFALLAHGGVSGVKVAGPVAVDAYAQAGVVGARDRDLFADGAVKLNVPVTSGVSVGVGAWGAAQPGVERLDVGPQVTMTLPGGGASLKLSAEWRVRVAGDAEPGSGPALTLATDF